MSLLALKSAKTRHQKAMEAHYPGTITIGSTPYACAVQIGGIEQRQNASGHGFTPIQILSASVFKSLLPTAPASRSMIACKGHDWRIDQVAGEDACEAAWQITAVRFPISG